MKFLHIADVHLGSKMESRMPPEKASERRAELLFAFSGAVRYATENRINKILISGDLFDSDRPFKKDKDFFFGLVKRTPEITFYYLRGNHDVKERFVAEEPENLKTFSDSWTSYEDGDTVISGIEISRENESSLYTSLSLDKTKTNVVMLHGIASDTVGDDKINLRELKGRGIDYLALGHVHSHSVGRLDERAVMAYPGCLEGRGFDECGEKGFLVVDTDSKNGTSVKFIKSSIREIKEISVDVSQAKNAFDAFSIAKDAADTSSKNLLRVNLTGSLSFTAENLAKTVEKYLSDYFYFVSVKDKTKLSVDFDKISGEISLRGEFLRLVASSDLSEEEKREVITFGFNALSGEEIEIVG